MAESNSFFFQLLDPGFSSLFQSAGKTIIPLARLVPYTPIFSESGDLPRKAPLVLCEELYGVNPQTCNSLLIIYARKRSQSLVMRRGTGTTLSSNRKGGIVIKVGNLGAGGKPIRELR